VLPRARSLSTPRGRALTAPIGGCALGSMGRRRFRWCWGGTYPDRSPPWARASAIGVLEAGRDGAYAEKLAITAAIIAKKPDRLSHVDAAALALTGLSAIISVDATNFSAARPSSSTAGPAGWRASPSGLPSKAGSAALRRGFVCEPW
jgi:hypothetical protein